MRIKLLECKDAPATQRFSHVPGQLESREDHVVVDMVDDSSSVTLSESIPVPEPSLRITPAQSRMVAALNALPQLKKERVYMPDARNAHAAIIVRDVKSEKIGEGVLRHWADAFLM
jgi:hypothetical protein